MRDDHHRRRRRRARPEREKFYNLWIHSLGLPLFDGTSNEMTATS